MMNKESQLVPLRVGMQTLVGLNEPTWPSSRGNCCEIIMAEPQKAEDRFNGAVSINLKAEPIAHLKSLGIESIEADVYSEGESKWIVFKDPLYSGYYTNGICWCHTPPKEIEEQILADHPNLRKKNEQRTTD